MKKLLCAVIGFIVVLFLVKVGMDSLLPKIHPDQLDTIEELEDKFKPVSFYHLDSYLFDEDKLTLKDYFKEEPCVALSDTSYSYIYSSDHLMLSYDIVIYVDDIQHYDYINTMELKEETLLEDTVVRMYSNRDDGVYTYFTYSWNEHCIVVELVFDELIVHKDVYSNEVIKNAVLEMIHDSMYLTRD